MVLVGGIATAVTVPMVVFASHTSAQSSQGSDTSTESPQDSNKPDRVTAECEAETKHSYEAMSPSGDYLVTKKDADPTRHHDGESTKMIDADDDDPDANTFHVSAVNSSGVAIGRERDIADPTKGWRYTDGEVEELSLPDGWKGREDVGVNPTSINDDGVVVGFVEGESDGEDRTAPAKWEPGSETATLLDGEKDGAAKAIDGDTVIGYEEDGDEQQLVKWNSDGTRQDWEGPSGADLEPHSLNGDWTVYDTEDGAVRLNLSNDKEDKLPSDFSSTDSAEPAIARTHIDDKGNVYGHYDTGHAGYVGPDGKQHEISMPDKDQEANAGEENPSDEGGALIQYVVRGVSNDGSKLVGARQKTDGEGYFDDDGGGGDAGRVWSCEAS